MIALAGPVTYGGIFTHDDDVVLIPFVIGAPTLVTIQTLSFADGEVGFEPVLTLFDGTGSPIQQDATGGVTPAGCGARLIDSTSGFCLDAYIQTTLNADHYTLALSQWDNTPTGLLGDPFTQTGNGDYTGPEVLGAPGAFLLSDGSQRTSAWRLQIDGLPVPEPATAGLTSALALALIAAHRRRRGVRLGL